MRKAAAASSYTVRVPEDKAGGRLDRVLADALGALSRTRLKGLIEAGRVADGEGVPCTDPARRVRPGETFAVSVPACAPARPQAQAIPLHVVYEDGDLIVIDKPAGLVVHPAPGNPDRTLVNALLAHCGDSLSGIGGEGRPGIVHRLDKGTSGLMVAAKHDAAHRGLSAQFAERTIERAYQAVVWGLPRPPKGEIAGNIGRNPRNRKKMAVVKRGGRPALTRYRVIRAVGSRAALVECRLATGRTHQIRVHMACRGHPVVGDAQYGGGAHRLAPSATEARRALAGFNRLALHAYILGFSHPVTGEPLRFEAILHHDIRRLIEILEGI